MNAQTRRTGKWNVLAVVLSYITTDISYGYYKRIWKPKTSIQAIIAGFFSFYMGIWDAGWYAKKQQSCRETAVALQWGIKSAATS